MCIGAYGEQIGLPMADRPADMWNCPIFGDEERWIKKRDIVSSTAEAAGRNPSDVEPSVTVERQLPNTDDESASFRDDLEHMASLGVRHFVMDFGHPQSTAPVLRFVEQVLEPMKALAR